MLYMEVRFIESLESGLRLHAVAGCCPDGYLCQTAGNCVPPSGSAYTYGCPASFTLCPASMSYGCCRTGMACAVNQCYSTEPVTLTTTMRITTTQEGVRATYELISTTIRTPEAPTVLPTVDADDNNGQAVFKYFPSAIAKATPTASTAPEKGGGGGLSKGTLAGIIAGSVAFLIIVLVAAFIIIRHLNNVVAAVSSKQSDGSRVRPPMKEFKPSNSEVDALSVDPLMLSPRPANPAPGSKVSSAYVSVASGVGSNDSTPVGPVDGYHQVSRNDGHSRQTSVDTPGNREDYFDIASGTPRFSQQSVSALPLMMNQRNSDPRGAYSHVRNWSNGSGGSDAVGPGAMWQQPLPSELEATPYVPELPSTPMRMESSRRSSGGEADVTRPMMTHQRNRSDQRSPIDSAGPPLTAVDEEIHGFHGPNDYFMGQTSYRPPGQGDGYSTTGHMSPR